MAKKIAVKEITRDDLIEAEERVWRRIDIIEKLNERLYRIVLDESIMLSLLMRMDEINRMASFLKEFMLRKYSNMRKNPSYTKVKLEKEFIARFLMLYYFIDLDRLRGIVAVPPELREIMGYLKSTDIYIEKNMLSFLRSLFMYGNYTRVRRLVTGLVDDMIRHVWINKHDTLAVKSLDTEKVIANPLSRIIARNILLGYANVSEEGFRVGVFCGLGFGKTTYSFFSCYGALRFIGVDEELALKATGSLIINDPIELLFMMQIVTDEQDLRLPFLVADDVAAIISKYWSFADRHTKQAAISFIRSLKISREKLGVVILPSDVSESIPKGIRESIDIYIEGDGVMLRNKSVLWIYGESAPKAKTKLLEAPEIKSRGEVKMLDDIVGTASPPMFVPSNIYAELTRIKLRFRSMQLKKTLIELLRSSLSDEELRKLASDVEDYEE